MVGTNNFPDCSNMCHEASGSGLKRSIGVGKGTIRLDDFDHADAIFVFGQNPAPTTRACCTACVTPPIAARRSSPSTPCASADWSVSPIRKTAGSGDLESGRHQLYLLPAEPGGDMAGARHGQGAGGNPSRPHRRGRKGLFDEAFINAATQGVEDYLAAVDATSWEQIEQQSGLSEQQLREAAAIYQSADRVICTGDGHHAA